MSAFTTYSVAPPYPPSDDLPEDLSGGEWVDVSFAARRYGPGGVRVQVSWGAWAAVEAGRLSLLELMTALRRAAEQAPGLAYGVVLETCPPTSAVYLGSIRDEPVYGVRLDGGQ